MRCTQPDRISLKNKREGEKCYAERTMDENKGKEQQGRKGPWSTMPS